MNTFLVSHLSSERTNPGQNTDKEKSTVWYRRIDDMFVCFRSEKLEKLRCLGNEIRNDVKEAIYKLENWVLKVTVEYGEERIVEE